MITLKDGIDKICDLYFTLDKNLPLLSNPVKLMSIARGTEFNVKRHPYVYSSEESRLEFYHFAPSERSSYKRITIDVGLFPASNYITMNRLEANVKVYSHLDNEVRTRFMLQQGARELKQVKVSDEKHIPLLLELVQFLDEQHKHELRHKQKEAEEEHNKTRAARVISDKLLFGEA